MLNVAPARRYHRDSYGLPYLAHAMGRRYGGFRRVRWARLRGDPIWHASRAAYAGFLFRCYSHPYYPNRRRVRKVAVGHTLGKLATIKSCLVCFHCSLVWLI